MNKFILFPELLGSDQYIPMDGRLGLVKIIEHGRERGEVLNAVFNQGVTKFEVHFGTIKNSTRQTTVKL